MSEKATLKSYEVTIQKTITYDAVIEVDAESEAEAEKLAMRQVEAGDHDDTFLDNLQDENWEVTETNCTSDDDE
jgi:hypothetical protein